MVRKSSEISRPNGTPTESISASNAVSLNRRRPPVYSFCGSLAAAFFAHEPFAGNLDCCMFARSANVLARCEGLLDELIALGGAHTLDGRLVIVGGEVARDRAGGDLFGEKTQAQCVHYAAL